MKIQLVYNKINYQCDLAFEYYHKDNAIQVYHPEMSYFEIPKVTRPDYFNKDGKFLICLSQQCCFDTYMSKNSKPIKFMYMYYPGTSIGNEIIIPVLTKLGIK